MLYLLFCMLLQAEPLKVPHLKDETTLIRVKAEPLAYAEKVITVSGVIEIDDYYNFSYSDCEKTHISFEFREVGATTDDLGQRLHVYALRSPMWLAVVDLLAEQSEQAASRQQPMLARVKVKLNGQAFARDKQWNMVEAVDIQFAEDRLTKWSEWTGEINRQQEAKAQADAIAAKEKMASEKVANAAKAKAELDAIELKKWRVWKISGKDVTAKYSGINSGFVKVVDKDGTAHKIPVDKLTKDEQEWLKSKPWLPMKVPAKKK